MAGDVRLSVCIATFGRGAFIGQTLGSLLPQTGPAVEVIVVDGGSPDDTPAVVAEWSARFPQLKYFRQQRNEGVDRDFDKAIGFATGEYCWLFSDDDLLVPDAVEVVLAHLRSDPDLLVVNAEIRDKELERVLKPRQLPIEHNRVFDASGMEDFFALAGSYLSFIGGVVIRRETWLSRVREPYYGSLFIHVGVIFQAPLNRVEMVARPLIRIRYGNAMWSARGFDIWTRLWPQLVWSFDAFGESSRAKVIAREPARSPRQLVWYRAIGAMQASDLRSPSLAARVVARLPARWLNAISAVSLVLRPTADSGMQLYELERAGCATALTKWIARRSRSRETGR